MSAELRIHRDLVPHTGVLLPGERSLVSPLLPTGDPQQQAAARQSLQPAGILDATGAISPAWSAVLTPLSLSERKVTISLFFPGRHITIDRYFTRDGNTITLLEGDDQITSLGMNISTEDLLAATGLSDDEISNRVPPVMISLNGPDFLFLTALMDNERACTIDALMRSVQDNRPLPPVVQTDESARKLLAAYQTPGEDSPFLSAAADLAGTQALALARQTAPPWNSLTAKGIVIPSPNGNYLLSDPLRALVRRLILTDFSMEVVITRSTADREELLDQAYCFRADGLLAWMKIRTGRPDLLSLHAIPAGALVKMTTTLVSDPSYTLTAFDAPEQPLPASPVQQPKAERKFCPQCGKPLRPGLKFCSSCGAKIV